MKFLGLGSLALAAFAAMPLGVASGQTRAPVQAPAAAPAKAPTSGTGAAAKAQAPAPAPAPSTPPPSAAQANMMVPANVLTMPASQMITVNGKQMSAGAVRQDIHAQILKQAGPPKLLRVASGKKPRQAAMSAGSVPTPGRTAGATEAFNADCTGRPPAILGISGALTPGQEITVIGNCFGDQTGQVKLIGPFPGGSLELTFARWANGKIVAAVPAVRGVPDQTVAISVVSAAKAESPTKPVSFVATREHVEVPARFWTASSHFDVLWQATNAGPTKEETSPTQFSVTVNAACALDTMDATATVGAVQSVTGWSEGPPNAATIQVAWTPQRTVTTYNYVVASTSNVFLSTTIDVKASANCPVGIAP